MNKEENKLHIKIEALLFYIAEPISIKKLSEILECSKEEVESAINTLGNELRDRGVRLIQKDNDVVLVSTPETAGLIEKVIKEERERDLGKAGLETLAIIAYTNGSTRKEIEYIRGVNCQFVLRNLLLRGLIEKKDGSVRGAVYTITLDALRYLGISKVSDLPEYTKIESELTTVKTEKQTEEVDSNE